MHSLYGKGKAFPVQGCLDMGEYLCVVFSIELGLGVCDQHNTAVLLVFALATQ